MRTVEPASAVPLSSGLLSLAGELGELRAFRGGYLSWDVADDLDDAIIEHAVKLTLHPGQVDQADIDRLRAQGLADLDILDLNNMVAYYCYTNRVANGLGLKTTIDSTREATLALGYPKWKTSIGIALRTAAAGIATGALVALARIAGETAPLLFTALNNQFWTTNLNAPMSNLPVVIFQFAMSPYSDWQELAWAGALLITLTVLVLNIVARLFFRQPAAK